MSKDSDLVGYQADVRNSHKYQQLPLIPVEEFLAQHPEHATSDENALMEARIEQERAERDALVQQRQELVKRKQKLISDNKRRKDDLANLDHDLEKFIDVRPPDSRRCWQLLTKFRRRNLSWSSSRKPHEIHAIIPHTQGSEPRGEARRHAFSLTTLCYSTVSTGEGGTAIARPAMRQTIVHGPSLVHGSLHTP